MTPRTPAAEGNAYGDGREALVAATVDIVSAQGLQAMSYRKVAARAGVANTLITHHFGSRGALLQEAAEWATQRTLDLVDMTRGADFSPEFVDEFVSKIAGEPLLQIFQYEMLLEGRRDPEVKTSMSLLYQRYMDAFRAGLEERGYADATTLARLLFAATDGLVMQQLTSARREDVVDAFLLLGRMLRAWRAQQD